MTLTMKEKEHWKDRIAHKIERRIQGLVAATEPNYLESLPARVREKAIETLGLIENQASQKSVEAEIERLRLSLTNLKYESLRIATSYSNPVILNMNDWNVNQEIENKIKSLQPILERQILQDDELGRAILKLREEKDEMLDTVWLATSNKQIRDLWLSVTGFLGEEPTELQTAAMKSIEIIDA